MKGIEQIESQNISKVVEQRLNLMPADEQRNGVNELADAFGPDDPIVRHAAHVAGDNIEMLTPGTDKYDPAVVAMKNPSVVNALATAQNAVQTAQNPTDQGKAQGLMRTALEQSFAAQRLVGIPAGQEQVLTRQQAEAYGAAADDPKQAKGIVNQMQSLYGPEYSTRALQQIFTNKGKLNGSVQMALLNPDSERVWAAAQFTPEKSDPKDETIQTINDTLKNDPDWKGFWASQRDDYTAAKRQTQMAQAMPGMAQYYMMQLGMQPDAAVKAVIGDTIGKAYTMTPSGNGSQLALPSKEVPTAQDANGLVDKANLALAALLQKRDLMKGTIQDQGHLQWQAIQNGHWAWDAKTGGLTRMYDGTNGINAVRLDDGSNVSFSLSGLRASNVVRPHFTDIHGRPDDGGEHEAAGDPGSPAYHLDSDASSLLVPQTPAPDNSPILSMPAEKPSRPPTTSLNEKLPASMKGLGPSFEKFGRQYGVDPALLAAISMHETGLGTSRAYTEGNNAMGVSNSKGPISFASKEDGIEHMAQTLAMSPLYSNWRKSGSIDDLASVYAPIGAENDPRNLNKDWSSGVSKFYNQLKG